MATAKDNRGMSPRPTNEPNTDTYRGKVGAAIRARREKLSISIAEFVDSIALYGIVIKDKTLYAWETGRNPVPIDNLPAIAAVLQTTVKRLMPDA